MKLKLIDALKLVDRSSKNEGSIEWFRLVESLSLNQYSMPQDFEERFKTYWLLNWLCTDTWVGLQAIYFDGELAGMVWQPSRKGEVDIEFMSVEIARKIRDYILSANPDTEFSLVNLEEDIEDTYGVAYNSQLVVDSGIYQGQQVTIDRQFIRDIRNNIDEWTNLIVNTADGEKIKISMDEFSMPIHITRDKS